MSPAYPLAVILDNLNLAWNTSGNGKWQIYPYRYFHKVILTSYREYAKSLSCIQTMLLSNSLKLSISFSTMYEQLSTATKAVPFSMVMDVDKYMSTLSGSNGLKDYGP